MHEAILSPFRKSGRDFLQQSKILGISAVNKQKRLSNSKNIAAIGIGKTRSITPLWYKSYISKAGDNEFTEVPIASEEKMISIYNFAKKPQDEKINLIRANSSFKRLLIYRTKKQNFHQLQLTYVPDYDYLERNHFDASSTQINKLGDFSGYVEYSSVKDERTIFVLRFEKGKFISKYHIKKLNTKPGNGTLKLGSGEIGTRGWEEKCVPKYGQVCVLHGDPEVETCGPMEIVGEDCHDVWVEDPVDPEEPTDPCYDENQMYICDPENPDPDEQLDCAGTPGGTATESDCGCIGGTTGITGCEEVEDPCDQANRLEKHTRFKDMMIALKSLTGTNSQNREYGALFTYGANGGLTKTIISGDTDSAGIHFSMPTSGFDGLVHSHYTGLLSVFSPGDLIAMASIYSANKMNDTDTFSMTIVTDSGTQYMLMIDNPTVFGTYIQSMGTEAQISGLFENLFNIKTSNSASANELNFLSYLQASNTGLKLFKGNSTFADWSPIKNENGAIVANPCN